MTVDCPVKICAQPAIPNHHLLTIYYSLSFSLTTCIPSLEIWLRSTAKFDYRIGKVPTLLETW
jgi:hypothetical protein